MAVTGNSPGLRHIGTTDQRIRMPISNHWHTTAACAVSNPRRAASGAEAVKFTQIRSAAIKVEYITEKDMSPHRVLVPEDGQKYSF